jgi:hypothetical protein
VIATESFLDFDGTRIPLGEIQLVLGAAGARGADWNLGRDGLTWLSGTVSPAPGSADEVASARWFVDERSLDEVLATLTGVHKTFYAPGGTNAPRLELRVEAAGAGACVASLHTELDWDYYPSPATPADYRPHRVHLSAHALLRTTARAQGR